ncbi:hypothetical protein RQP46_006960 [Phenoliferia psychrophenolica]
MSASRIPQLLLSRAVPLVPTAGFSSATLRLASLSLPPPHTPAAPGYSQNTIDALFPSAPGAIRARKSLSREELVADARGLGVNDERIGPAKALVEAWLEEGRRVMVEHVRKGNWKGDDGVREGIRERLRYNEPVRATLTEALALLGAATSSPLSSVVALLPIPSPAGYLGHVAHVAQDLAKATGDESQGVAWYRTRARIGTVYGLAELHQLSPTISALPPSERLPATFELVDSLLTGSDAIAAKVKDTEEFGTFVLLTMNDLGDVELEERKASSPVSPSPNELASDSPSREVRSLPPIEGTEAWIFLAGSFVTEMICLGGAFSWSIFQSYLSSSPDSLLKDASSVTVSAIGTLLLSMIYFAPGLAGPFLRRYPHRARTATFAAVLLASGSLLVASFLERSAGALMVFVGLLHGIGVGVATTTYMMWLPQWFQARRGLANGIAFAGAGTGGLFFPPLFNATLKLGFGWTMRIWALIILMGAGTSLCLNHFRRQRWIVRSVLLSGDLLHLTGSKLIR